MTRFTKAKVLHIFGPIRVHLFRVEQNSRKSQGSTNYKEHFNKVILKSYQNKVRR